MRELLAKTLAYRLTSTGLTMLAALMVTGSISVATSVGALEFVLKSVFYAGFEHVWRRRYGQRRRTRDPRVRNVHWYR